MPDVATAADVLRRGVQAHDVRALVVLGSGLHAVAEALSDAEEIAFAGIPGFPRPTVAGHAGRVVFGALAGVGVACMLGRAHLYEGRTPEEVALPVRAFAHAGVGAVVLTNAAGGLDPALEPGALVLLSDHLNLQGANVLASPGGGQHGRRFIAMADAYDEGLRAAASRAAERLGIPLREGVYAGVLGPTFETAAEARALRSLGADVVGMSTVQEAIAARQAGMRVMGLSVVSNAAGSSDDAHEAVLAGVSTASSRVVALLTETLREQFGRGA